MPSSLQSSKIGWLVLAALICITGGSCTVISDGASLKTTELRPAIVPLTNQTGEALDHLDLSLIPHASSEEQLTKIEFLASYLQQELGIPVHVTLAQNYDEAVNLLVTEKVAIAYLGAASYLKAKQQNPNLEPILAAINKDSGRPWYTSVVIGKAGVNNLGQLQGKRFGFVSTASTSGFLIPSYHLKQLGFDPSTYFSNINYAGSHDQNVASLIAGEVDAISIDEDTYKRNRNLGILKPDQYTVLWKSEPIPNPPIVVSTKLLSGEAILTLKRILIAAPEGLVSVTGADSIGYTIVEDQDYSTIREIYQSLE
jgi:phosphonate transport system substrate-binding protein